MMRCGSVWLCMCLLALVKAQLLDLFEGDVCKEANGEKWICKPMSNCPKYQQDLKKGIRPTTCAFVNRKPLICCEPSRKSKQMCEEYGKAVFDETFDPFTGKAQTAEYCAVVEPLISGGKKAQPKEYPHMALIGYGRKGDIKWNCGGSLISDRYVLSAAHCTDGGESLGKAKWVRLGEYNVKSTTDEAESNAQPQDFEIIERINHPNYSSVVYNDIALYKLKNKVQFNEFIRPICLNTERQMTKSFAIATGWGWLEQNGRRGDILQKVNLTFTSKEKCSKYYAAGAGDLKSGLNEESMICAGNLYNDGDTCRGDSGGPLQKRLEKPYCMYSQIGITSFGRVCGSHQPSVFTRVSHFVDWIEGIVWP